ncbi:MAG: hypothetical protein RL205_25 [Actinomycetota bacterium]|jgi:hypothetical protein
MTTAICTRTEIDPRGPRFGGTITTIVLAIALVTVGSPLSDVLVVWQAIVFGLGAIVGLHAQPYGILYRTIIGPRLAPPQVLEDAAPPRFAQAVGLIFMIVAIVSLVLGATIVAAIAIGFALAAAFLNAAFDFCLGCEMYLLGARLRHR